MTLDEVQAVVDEAHKREAAGRRPLASARRDPPRACSRRRLLRAHRTRHRARVSGGHHRDDCASGPRRWAAARSSGRRRSKALLQLRIRARQSRAARRSAPGTTGLPDVDRRRHQARRSSIRTSSRTSRSHRADARRSRASSSNCASAGVTLLIGTDSGIPMNFHSQATWHELDAWVNRLRRRSDVRHPRRHLLAGGRDESDSQVGTVSRRQVRRHHRRARRRASPHRSPRATGHRDQARSAIQVDGRARRAGTATDRTRKMRFQSFFMLITVQPFFFASS